MKPRGHGADFERIVAAAMTAPDPVGALRRAARARGLDADLRARLLGADADGLRMSALLVARLRFERLLRGSAEAEAFYETDPAGFTATFRRYHQSVPPSAFFPREEAALWEAFRMRSRASGATRARRRRR